MAKKNRGSDLPIQQEVTTASYHTGKDAEIHYANASFCNNHYPVHSDGKTTSRIAYSKSDQDYYRPDESLPKKHTDIMLESLFAYETVGAIRNIMDLVSELASAGIKLSHPSPRIERNYRNWFNRINGPYVTERLASNLEKFATCIIRREVERVNKRIRKDLQTSQAKIEPIKAKKFEIPVKYTMLNPCMIDVVNEAASTFLSDEDITYAYKIPRSLKHLILHPRNEIHRNFVKKLPSDIVNAVKTENPDNLVPITRDNLEVLHYKKDDWQAWAKPVVYGVLQDVKLLNKMKMADFSVLDSAMDMVRIYKLGSLEHEIVPGEGAVNALGAMLEATNPGGIRNIIWGPDIQLLESNDAGFLSVLGNEKYESSWNNIHDGMGIPPTLTGTTAGGGTTNNLLSLKTLTKRLIYIRQQIIKFWTKEIEIFRKAYGYRVAAEIEFDVLNFGDEEAEKKLWIELADRNIISDEWLQVKFGANPMIETNRLNREHRARLNKQRVPKGGPYTEQIEWERTTKKGLVDQGILEPTELNLDLEDEDNLKELDDIPNLKDGNSETGAPPDQEGGGQSPPSDGSGGGRPAGSKDTKPRKKRSVQPVSQANKIWAAQAQKKISKILNPHYADHFGVASIREIKGGDFAYIEQSKFNTLLNLKPGCELTEEAILEAASVLSTDNAVKWVEYNQAMVEVELQIERKLKIEERQEIQREFINA